MSTSRMSPRRGGTGAPRTSATGRPAVLPSASSAADASSSATARTVERMTRPSASGVPRRSSSGSRPDTPIATSTMPQRHGRPKLSDTMTGTSTPNRSRIAVRIAAGRRIGVVRQQRDDRARPGPDVRGVDAAVRAHEAVRRLGDEHAVGHPHDPPRLAQHDLDLAGVAVAALGELDRLGSRLDGRQVDDRALGLGDDLLGHDEHVVVAQRQERPWRRRERRRAISAGRSSPGTISGEAVDRDDLEPGASAATSASRSSSLDEQQVVGRVEVEGQRSVELDDSRRRRGAPRWAAAAVAAECDWR